jgi:stress response protein SCP2
MELNLSKTTALLDLTKVAPSLVEVRGELSWGMHPIKGQEFDLDIFAFITSNGKIGSTADVVFFNNKTAYNGAVVYPRDSRDGGDVEEVTVKLGSVPADKDSIEIFVFIHEGVQRQQDFSMVQSGSFKLFDEKGTLIQDYKLQQFVNGTALHIGSLIRNPSGWGFQPVGESAVANPNEVLSAFV